MEKRIIPSSKEQLPVIGLGTYKNFDVGNTGRGPLEKIIETLSSYPHTMIDSSPMYGRSEEVVGDLIEKTETTNKFFLATKVWVTGQEEGIKQMNQSFRLMKTYQMDLMQIHNLVDWRAHMPTLLAWKACGKIKYNGITHYHESAYGNMEDVIRKERLDFLQINYSILRREAEDRLLKIAADKGMAVIINQPFDSGTLFSLVKNKKLPGFAADFACETWAQYFLKFILSNTFVTCVIPATSNPDHFNDFTKAGDGIYPDENLRKRMIEYLKK